MLKFLIIALGLAPFAAPTVTQAQSFPALGTGLASCESLWVERNQILNEAGNCFNTRLGQSVFDSDECSPGPPALSEGDLNRLAGIERAEARLACAINTNSENITVDGRYGPLRFGEGAIRLGPWLRVLSTLDVFPRDGGRQRSCVVDGLSGKPEDTLALRSGPDVRYRKIGALVNGTRVFSGAACIGRWCFAESVQVGNRIERRNGWFHVRWCRA